MPTSASWIEKSDAIEGVMTWSLEAMFARMWASALRSEGLPSLKPLIHAHLCHSGKRFRWINSECLQVRQPCFYSEPFF